MASELRFDQKVAVITGAGNGLGRSHARLLGQRGASVVVNDPGGDAFGDGGSSEVADRVVEEIKDGGGDAVASYDSVEVGEKIIECALDTFGRVDVVVNNAGIVRDQSFAKMTDEDWNRIQAIHLRGCFKVTRAAWPHMRDQEYGRIVNTSSAAGIYGNFGQANYSAAKLGVFGMARTLAIEGRRRNILVNAIAPVAASRLTEKVLPAELVAALDPKDVSALIAFLCHESCEESGALFEVGGGFFAKLRWERAAGKTFRIGRRISPEAVREAWPSITSFEETTHPVDIVAAMAPIIANVNYGTDKGGNEPIDLARISHEIP
ncbi:MAG: serine/threonine protein kinase [Gemmatimonadetes bacterium]|nr:serine/threonine protein kinase [Gemmatimonadota bacterium]